MKAINILRTLLSESVNTENCGIVKVYEKMPYTEFIRQYLCHDFQDQILDYHRCVGCRFCMAACPYGSRSFNFMDPRPHVKDLNPAYPTRMRGVVEKCTFCAERLEKGQMPACVEVSNGAIMFGDLNDPNSLVRKVLANNFSIRRKPELGTDPGVYYII